MKKLICCLFLLWIMSLQNYAQSTYSVHLNYNQINSTALQESLSPIRPGIPNQTPFWNKYSKRFTYAPAFNVNPADGVSSYKFLLFADDFPNADDHTIYTFTADKPYCSLSPVWDKIPVGHYELQIMALDASGKENKILFRRRFQRSAVFHGPYQEPVMSYKESAKKALAYLYNKPFIQSWADKIAPDTIGYHLYCYPAKIISAVTELMMNYAKLSPENHQKAMKIAVNAANYLIGISESKDAPLAYFPPTYAGEGDKRDTAPKRFRNQFMMIYPAQTACIYLDLYDVTKNKIYKEAALHIASTYQKLQESSGTWKLRIWNTGKPVTEVDCIPTVIIQFFDRLSSQYHIRRYQGLRDKAYLWIMNHPMKDFNWSGQFEDQNPLLPYQDLTKDDAANFATTLFEQSSANPSYKAMADELLRYSEDQFVVWDKSNPIWPAPSALEQYFCYTPINASAACMIDAYMNAYRATQKELYLAKAIGIANAVTITQHAEDGRYPTFWATDRQKLDPDEMDWLNCTSYTVKMMLAMDSLLTKLGSGATK
jgi:hypothetical protein